MQISSTTRIQLILLMLLTGCDYYAKPYRPVPEQFEAQFLDGGVLDRSVLSGKIGIQMPVAIAKGETLGPLGTNQVPSTVFIDRRGVIVAAASGERKRSFLEARTRELLK